MAWEDRTKAEKRQARREAAEYAATDDDKTYELVDDKSRRRYAVTGRNSAAAVARSTGYTPREKK